MAYPTAVFSAFSFCGFVMCAIPLSWHIQAWNTGTCLYMIWTGLGCLNLFINSIIWNGNAINWAPVWCDISSKFTIGLSVALSACSLCINRRLYHIACIRVVAPTKADKRRSVMVDLAIGLGIPVVVMALHYIIQGHRFNIFEDFGCSPASYYTWPMYPLLLLPPILIGLFSATYSVLTITAFYKNNAQFNAILSSNGNVSFNRFLRLMCLASFEVLFNIPVALYGIYLQSRNPLNPYISWENVHYEFSHVQEVPSLIWRNDYYLQLDLEESRWIVVFCAFVFFAFFGFADEAKKNYRYAIQSVVKRVGFSTGSSSFGSGINSSDYGSEGMKSKAFGSSGKVRPILPIFVHKEMLQRHNSMDSFSNMSIGDVGGALLRNEPRSPSDPEKKLDYYPDLSYAALSTSGETKVNNNNDSLRLSSFPSSSASLNSTATSITYPTPARTRQDSGIEVSSVHRDDSIHVVEPTDPLPTTTSNTPFESSSSQPQPTGHSAV